MSLTWTNVLYVYLITLIPAFLLICYTVMYDIKCLLGKAQPDSKFGYNWSWPWTQSLMYYITVILLIPVVNVMVIIWYGAMTILYRVRFGKWD